MNLYLITLAVCLLSGTVSAQSTIRNSTPALVSGPEAEQAAADQNIAASLVYDLQSLKQEMSILRGLIERQGHELKRLKQQRLDDYLDLDKRVSALHSRALSVPPTPAYSLAAGEPAVSVIGSVAVGADGGKLYSSAIDLLLNKRDYAGAEGKFTQYAQQYPKGQYIPNVYYWQGQILSAGGKKQEAESMFVQLINQYPSHAKTPDAKFKLAKIYFGQGKKEQAKVILEEVASSNSDAALLAKSFIAKNY